ncbi:outer membrane beta-barrel protein [Marivirga sp.]|uniref:outer membrane beta-barrel protein n=1 Tax=Marivirga sp. TaxID=2018662 RepID=UPI002D7EE62F|nr:outer membrane beta-barrel protein [Marivirga sp.]HET8858909.1 outer membrane beta-barrel protein [Marivirga sp.]
MKNIVLTAILLLSTSLLFSQHSDNTSSDHISDSPSKNIENHESVNLHHTKDTLMVAFNGYLETFYSYNFNKPSNNINALRGFDFIANSLTVGNFVIGVDAKYNNFSTRLAINIGMTPSQFYKQEPTTPASYQVPSLSSVSWQFIQEAIVNYDFENVKGLSAQMGIMATPIGIEGLPSFQTWETSMANPGMHKKDYRENWNFSRSNAFIHVPDYHSGVRFLYSPSPKNTFSLYLVNGQNMVTDNNVNKTVSVSYLWTPNNNVHFSALYMGGNERPTDYTFENSWRHIFDFHTRFSITKNIEFMTQFTPGFETTDAGNNQFLINVAYLKFITSEKNYISFRYEHMFERIFEGSSSNFLETFNENNEAGLYGITGTISHILVKDHLMIRGEYRHDYGTQNWFYKGTLQPSGKEDYPFLTNASRQNTVSFSVVGWF